MGEYIDLINNISISQFTFNETFGNDTITPAIQGANNFTNGWLGLGILAPIWFGLYKHISDRSNLFELTQLQAMISTNALVFTLAIAMFYVGIFTAVQHFIWITTLVFLMNVVGVLRTS